MRVSQKEAERLGLIPRGNKYGATTDTVDGIKFDSKREAVRYKELKVYERAGLIRELELQREFELIPAQFEFIQKKRGCGLKKGKCIERAVKYKADFYYFDTESGKYICEDVKGFRTKDYIIKRKLMLFVYGIRIKEV